ncbi:MAG TPA: heme ABC transporter ATP-binding protein [Nevskiales bacterium]|nr:heme ABC transporter ATP-binding protein [Nevskiales bacterium]
MLECRDATLRLRGRVLLQDLSLQLRPGELLAVLGPNGAGKSSLLRILSGELAPSSGGILMNGRSLDTTPRQILARLRAVMPQADRLSFPFSVAEVVLLGRTPHTLRHGNAQDEHIAQAALAAVDALPLAARDYTSLSGGERQRVQLARALAQIWESDADAPRYLLLDEPTASLDLAHQHGVLRLLNRLKLRHIGVLAVLHDLNLAARYADRVALLHGGRLLGCGPPQDVLQEDRLSQVYGLAVRRIRVGDEAPLIVAV